jgi:hypothetical protein
MSYVTVPKEAFDFIYILREKYPHHANALDNIDGGLNNRLWNQVSDDLIFLSNQEDLQNSQDLITLYNNLIVNVEKAFNPLKLILIIQNVIKNFSSKLTLLSLLL